MQITGCSRRVVSARLKRSHIQSHSYCRMKAHLQQVVCLRWVDGMPVNDNHAEAETVHYFVSTSPGRGCPLWQVMQLIARTESPIRGCFTPKYFLLIPMVIAIIRRAI